jgi:hypothetical protein
MKPNWEVGKRKRVYGGKQAPGTGPSFFGVHHNINAT